jgi:hypothetical protein
MLYTIDPLGLRVWRLVIEIWWPLVLDRCLV